MVLVRSRIPVSTGRVSSIPRPGEIEAHRDETAGPQLRPECVEQRLALGSEAATDENSALADRLSTSSGFRGTSDGWTDLLADGRLDWQYTSASSGNVVQTAQTALTGWPGHRRAALAVAFGDDAPAALAAARASLRQGFASAARRYAQGWHEYLQSLKRPPRRWTAPTSAACIGCRR